MIIFEKVTKNYTVGNFKIKALDECSFTINKGEFVIIVGQSGAGKTTLLNMVGGMDVPSSGNIIINGVNISHMNQKQLTLFRRNNVGFIFQFYNLMPNLTALENIELAVEICKNPSPPQEVLEAVGLKDRQNNFPSQLSGGEQQRVSIARSLAKNTDLILCDEPTGALDYDTGKKILKLLQGIAKNEGKTVVLVTHNTAIKPIASKVMTIKNGQIIDIIENPSPKSIDDIEW